MPRELQKQEQGWSLTELLTVLTIMGIMAALAGPSYQAIAARVQARSAMSRATTPGRVRG